MSRKLTVAVALLGLMLTVESSWALADLVGTAFTFQGQLKDGGKPANNPAGYDFTFMLFDALTEGEQVGDKFYVHDVEVSDGLFTVELDFGPGIFDGAALWLGVLVRPGDDDTGGYTSLSPRQAITSAPYAQYALNTYWAADGEDIHSTNVGLVGIGTDAPLAILNIETTDKVFDDSALSSEELLIEASDAVLGLYSSDGGSWGSAVVLGEMSDDGTLVNKWSIARETSAAGADLRFTYGPEPGYADNPTILHLNGAKKLVGIGTTAPSTPLHVYQAKFGPPLLRLESEIPDFASYYMDVTETSFDSYTYFEGELLGNTLRLNADSPGYVSLAYGGGNVGIGGGVVLAKLHVQESDLFGFDSAALKNEDVVIEDTEAVLGLYSAHQQLWGSGVALGSVDATGNLINKWTLFRGGANISNSLFFTFGTSPTYTQNTFVMTMTVDGNVGIGTTTPAAPLQIEGGTDTLPDGGGYVVIGDENGLNLSLDNNEIMCRYNGSTETLIINSGGRVFLGDGARTTAGDLELLGDGIDDDTEPSAGGILIVGHDGDQNISIDANEIMARNDGEVSTLYLNNDGGDVIIAPGATTRVSVLEITGADLAEKFPTTEDAEPGTVMEIDPDHPGQLRVARGAYNRRVAGVVSGANNFKTGAILGNLPGSQDAPAIALSGRVWVRCDTTNGAITPGDLLTTSANRGQAMRVTDHARGQGAKLGKAMTPLAAGESGLVLVLVSLQ